MMNPFFSIVTPTYNRASMLPKAIESVIDQSFSNWELLIIDDGSTDNTEELIKSYKDKRIKYLFQQKSGRSKARNEGIRLAKADWVCFLDSDDYFLSDHLLVLHEVISEKKVEKTLIYTGIYKDVNGSLIKEPIYDTTRHLNPVRFIWEHFICIDSVCVNANILIDNKFCESYKPAIWEDTHLWLRIVSQYGMIQVNKYTTAYREHNDRSVAKTLNTIKTPNIKSYISFINDLFNNHFDKISEFIDFNEKKIYIDSKLKMFLYQARRNKQLITALKIWSIAVYNRFSFYLLIEFIKILANYIGLYREK